MIQYVCCDCSREEMFQYCEIWNIIFNRSDASALSFTVGAVIGVCLIVIQCKSSKPDFGTNWPIRSGQCTPFCERWYRKNVNNSSQQRQTHNKILTKILLSVYFILWLFLYLFVSLSLSLPLSASPHRRIALFFSSSFPHFSTIIRMRLCVCLSGYVFRFELYILFRWNYNSHEIVL